MSLDAACPPTRTTGTAQMVLNKAPMPTPTTMARAPAPHVGIVPTEDEVDCYEFLKAIYESALRAFNAFRIEGCSDNGDFHTFCKKTSELRRPFFQEWASQLWIAPWMVTHIMQVWPVGTP